MMWDNGRCIKEHELLIITSASHLVIVSLDATRCLEGGNWHRIDVRDVFGVNVTTLTMARFLLSFFFLGSRVPPRRLTLCCLIDCCQHRTTTMLPRPRWRPIRLFDRPASLRPTTRPLSLSDNRLCCRQLHLRGISIHNTIHPF